MKKGERRTTITTCIKPFPFPPSVLPFPSPSAMSWQRRLRSWESSRQWLGRMTLYPASRGGLSPTSNCWSNMLSKKPRSGRWACYAIHNLHVCIYNVPFPPSLSLPSLSLPSLSLPSLPSLSPTARSAVLRSAPSLEPSHLQWQPSPGRPPQPAIGSCHSRLSRAARSTADSAEGLRGAGAGKDRGRGCETGGG